MEQELYFDQKLAHQVVEAQVEAIADIVGSINMNVFTTINKEGIIF